MYQHRSRLGESIDLPVGKVVCVGQNYADHIAEMGAKTFENDEALLFIKPSTALCDIRQPLKIPTQRGECHNELEVAVLIGQRLTAVSEDEVGQGIWGYSLALDLTLRTIQAELKQKGRPWERAKAFDLSCPMAEFIPAEQVAHPQNLSLQLNVNGIVRQSGNTAMMLRTIPALIAEISQTFTLLPGDIVLTGTPAGVGPLTPGDQIHIRLDELLDIETSVIS